jgi:flagellin-like hook-associated protein FlgL
MTIAPFAPGAFRATNSARLLTDARMTLDDLQRQLASGKKSETFGGLGVQRITSLEMRAKRTELTSYQETITLTQIRVKQMDLSLNRLAKIGDDARSSAILPNYSVDSTGQTPMQKLARLGFDEAIDLLNSEVNGVRLFAGRKTDARPVLDPATILDGDSAGRAGVRQMIAERKAADLGLAPNLGRVVQGGAGTTATLTEDGTHPFGVKLTAASSTSANITAAYAAGPPAGVSFNVTANPAPGEEIRLGLRFPDGSIQPIVLKATAGPVTPPADAGGFEIGATPAATAANIRQALADMMARETTTNLPAASAQTASVAFFAGSENNPPQRVSGPPATATALVAGTAANTVIWYRGDDQAPSARQTQQARVDNGITVGVGAQANEEGVRRLMANLAVFSTETFSTAVATDQGRHQAMIDRIRIDLSATNGVQRVQDIQGEIANAAVTMNLAAERHRTKLGFVETVIADVENINQEETAAKLLSLQTKMQAAYQTTAIISRLNLTDYLR